MSATERVHRHLLAHEMKECPKDERFGFPVGPEMVHLAETVTLPGWVAIRAATCVIRWYPESGYGHYHNWVDAPDMAGLVRVLVAEIDSLSETKAVELASAVLESPLAEWARTQLRKSKYVRLRQLATSLDKPSHFAPR